MSDQSSDKMDTNQAGYEILGADLSVEGIKIPNIPADRWTPQDIISLHQVQLDTVKEKNRFFKWVIVTVVGGLLAGSANYVWRYFEHKERTEVEAQRFQYEVTKSYSSQLYEAFKEADEEASLSQTKRFAQLLAAITFDTKLQQKWSEYHQQVSQDWDDFQANEDWKKAAIEEQLQAAVQNVERLKETQSQLEKQLQLAQSASQKRLLNSQFTSVGERLVNAKVELSSERKKVERHWRDAEYEVTVLEELLDGAVVHKADRRTRTMPYHQVSSYIETTRQQCQVNKTVCTFGQFPTGKIISEGKTSIP